MNKMFFSLLMYLAVLSLDSAHAADLVCDVMTDYQHLHFVPGHTIGKAGFEGVVFSVTDVSADALSGAKLVDKYGVISGGNLKREKTFGLIGNPYRWAEYSRFRGSLTGKPTYVSPQLPTDFMKLKTFEASLKTDSGQGLFGYEMTCALTND